MAKNAGWGRRLRDALRDVEKARDGKLPLREIGERVAVLTGRATSYTPTAVRGWFQGQEPDAFAVAVALATVLDADPAYLILGETTGRLTAPEEPRREDIERARAVNQHKRNVAAQGGAKRAVGGDRPSRARRPKPQ